MRAHTKVNKIDLQLVESRFGQIEINLDKMISFRQGIVGMPQAQNFCLTNHPDPKHKAYNLLQSVDFDDLCFLAIPLGKDHYRNEESLISKYDYEAVLQELEFDDKNVELILIATIHNNIKPGESVVSVNLKAPIFINLDKMEAVQYVFNVKKYPLRYFV